jgi:rRNA maturation protein Nop10
MIARGQPNPCMNMNHRRSDAPVSHCPQCGGVVNSGITPRHCTEEAHATARRQQSIFCSHCGKQLVFPH